MKAAVETPIERNAPISTWFGVGGTADLLARPRTIDEITNLVRTHETVRILGDGANLLVDDDGIDGLVLSLEHLDTIEQLDDTTIRVGAGVNLPKLIVDTVRQSLGGLEGLGGIPASLGGAIAMNAGGSWGQIADTVRAVRVVTMDGSVRTIARDAIRFGYRTSGLRDVVIVEADLGMTAGDGPALREQLKEVMAYKKRTQPMADRSAGCAFKNPAIDGERVSAGMLIDQSGCKGLRHGSAHVSDRHANFILIDENGSARDAIELIEMVENRVNESKGITLEREVAIWRRGQ